jgi:hypothetical protein
VEHVFSVECLNCADQFGGIHGLSLMGDQP